MIVVIDNLITHEMVKHVHNLAIEKINCNFSVWNGTKTVDIKNFIDDDVIVGALKLITDTASKYCEEAIFDWGQIVEWPIESHQPFHFDTASKNTVLSSITYLNNDFRGGETVFADGTQIAPVPGRTVFFNGNSYLHGVNCVTKASRFTIPIWYRGK